MRFHKRVCVIYCVFLLFISLMCVRLYVLSSSDNNKSMAVLEGQYTAKITVAERSGFIYDRNLELLSHEKDGGVIVVNPAEISDVKNAVLVLAPLSQTNSYSDIYEKMLENTPFTLVTDKTEKAKAVSDTEKGILAFDTYRENNGIALHFLGYNNKDGKGMTGLRKSEGELLGKELSGSVTVRFERDALRKSMSSLTAEYEKYTSCDGIVTTLDKQLQTFCDGLGDVIKSGAVVVADCNSGEILALSSFPGYDAQHIEDVLDSDKGELLNRTVLSFAPGSVFKLVVAAAALETDIYYGDFSYDCVGKISVGDDEFSCHKHDGHGEQNLEQAFANSCNTYFISLAESIGLECIADTSRRLGLDTAASADFLAESKNYFLRENEQSQSYLANISFGQGDLCLSPLDMTEIYMSACGGYLVPLSSIKGEIRAGKEIPLGQKRKTRVFSPDTSEKLLSMMEKCVNYGTGKAAAVEDARVYGKTATAQTGRFTKDGVELEHKWFCGLYERDGKFTAITVLCDYTDDKNLSPAEIFARVVSYLKERGC